MKENCIIVGAGAYGEIYAEYLKEDYEVIGFIDDNSEIHHSLINGIEVLGDFDFLVTNLSKETNVFIPMGNNKVRVQLLKKAIEHGFKTPNFIHHSAQVPASVKLGKCVYISPGAHIMPLTVINDYVLISMGVNIAHHTTIDQGCFFCQGSNIGAFIHFKENVFCGIASTIVTGVGVVGEEAFIGAGAVVLQEVPARATVVGNPGRVIKIQD